MAGLGSLPLLLRARATVGMSAHEEPDLMRCDGSTASPLLDWRAAAGAAELCLLRMAGLALLLRPLTCCQVLLQPLVAGIMVACASTSGKR